MKQRLYGLLLCLLCIALIVTASNAIYGQASKSPIPEPDQLTQDDLQMASMQKYIGKLQKQIVVMQAEIDRLSAENKALKEASTP